jgi:enoyl-CoA hydratase/carnithine racemase
MAESDRPLASERRGRVLLLRLNRPEARNALNPDLMAALDRELGQAETDPEVRGVVLTGTGDRAFCAGLDLKSGSDGIRNSATGPFRRFLDGSLGIPVIGAANATAVAGGFELLLACDLVVASETALFGLPEVKRGLVAAGGGTLLASRIPVALAMELNLTGDTITAERAMAMGLINRVVPANAVIEEALTLAERIADNGPLAVAAAQRMVRASAEDMAKARELWSELVPKVFSSADAQEGARAFVERREPNWTAT